MITQQILVRLKKGTSIGLLPALIVAVTLAVTSPVDARGGTLHDVELVGLDFVPAEITVAAGDTIRWTRTAGTHSVTSGADCVYDELYFDQEMNAANSTFEWTVPAELTGTLEYFCRPHCAAFDMRGTVTVDGIIQRCDGDIDESGAVDFIDLLTLLNSWGSCPGCPADIDGNDAVDFQDLLSLLASWGPCN